MQRKKPTRRARPKNLRGYVVHWIDPATPDVISFYPESLPFNVANNMAKSLAVAGMRPQVAPIVVRNFSAELQKRQLKNAGKERVSSTPLTLIFENPDS